MDDDLYAELIKYKDIFIDSREGSVGKSPHEEFDLQGGDTFN